MEYFSEIKKVFTDCDKTNIVITPILHGLSNTNYRVEYNGNSIFLRIYGNVNDLEKSLKITNKGFGAKILHNFSKGRIEEWVSGHIMSHHDINVANLKNIAIELKRFHDSLNMNHNDLHFKNIFIQKNNIVFIDFEYSGYLDREYDIANFFNEWVHIYGSKEWYKCHLELFPSYENMQLFLKCYDHPGITIKSILDRLDDVNRYWINWAKKYKSCEYRLFESERQKLINHDFKSLMV